jgi:hypothetical protein
MNHAFGVIQWANADGIGTTYTVSGLSFQPKALQFAVVGSFDTVDSVSTVLDSRRGVGFAVSTSSRRAFATYSGDADGTTLGGTHVRTDCVVTSVDNAGNILARLDLDVINSDGFRLIIDDPTPTPSITVAWQAWGGSDITIAVVGDLSEPASTGNVDYTVTGFVSGATNQVVMFAGCQATALTTATNTSGGMHIGFATSGNSADQVTLCGSMEDNVSVSDTDGYCQTGECVSMIPTAGGNPDARATLTQFGTDNFRLNWLARAVTDRKTIFMALKGGAWKAGAYTIDGSAGSATATVSGLSFAPIGVDIIGRMTAQNAAGTATAEDRVAFGVGASTTSRHTIAAYDKDALETTEIGLTIQYDQVLAFPTTVGTLQSAYDINAMNSDGFQVIVDTAGGVASEWQGYLAFGTTPVGFTITASGTSYTSTGTATTLRVGSFTYLRHRK